MVALVRIERFEAAGEAVTGFHLRRVGVDHVGGFFDLADGLDAVLAGLDDEDRRETELVLANQLAGAAQDRHPFLPGPAGPGGVGRPGGGDGIVDVGLRAGDEATEDHVMVGGRTSFERLRARSFFAADDHGVGLTELALDLFQGTIERGMHRLDLLGGRGVGDLVGNGHGCSS